MTVNQLMRGVTGYLDAEIMPQMSGIKKYGSAVYLSLAELNAINYIKDAVNNPAIKMLGIVNGENVDAEKLRSAMINAMHNEPLKVDIPLIGTFTFTTADIDKLFDYMRRAST